MTVRNCNLISSLSKYVENIPKGTNASKQATMISFGTQVIGKIKEYSKVKFGYKDHVRKAILDSANDLAKNIKSSGNIIITSLMKSHINNIEGDVKDLIVKEATRFQELSDEEKIEFIDNIIHGKGDNEVLNALHEVHKKYPAIRATVSNSKITKELLESDEAVKGFIQDLETLSGKTIEDSDRANIIDAVEKSKLNGVDGINTTAFSKYLTPVDAEKYLEFMKKWNEDATNTGLIYSFENAMRDAGHEVHFGNSKMSGEREFISVIEHAINSKSFNIKNYSGNKNINYNKITQQALGIYNHFHNNLSDTDSSWLYNPTHKIFSVYRKVYQTLNYSGFVYSNLDRLNYNTIIKKAMESLPEFDEMFEKQFGDIRTNLSEYKKQFNWFIMHEAFSQFDEHGRLLFDNVKDGVGFQASRFSSSHLLEDIDRSIRNNVKGKFGLLIGIFSKIDNVSLDSGNDILRSTLKSAGWTDNHLNMIKKLLDLKKDTDLADDANLSKFGLKPEQQGVADQIQEMFHNTITPDDIDLLQDSDIQSIFSGSHYEKISPELARTKLKLDVNNAYEGFANKGINLSTGQTHASLNALTDSAIFNIPIIGDFLTLIARIARLHYVFQIGQLHSIRMGLTHGYLHNMLAKNMLWGAIASHSMALAIRGQIPNIDQYEKHPYESTIQELMSAFPLTAQASIIQTLLGKGDNGIASDSTFKPFIDLWRGATGDKTNFGGSAGDALFDTISQFIGRVPVVGAGINNLKDVFDHQFNPEEFNRKLRSGNISIYGSLNQ